MKHNAKNFIDRTGQKIGHWKVLKIADEQRVGNLRWTCQCLKCGHIKDWRIDSILKQKVTTRHLCSCMRYPKELAKGFIPPPPPVRVSTPQPEVPKPMEPPPPAHYRRRPKRTDTDKGKFEAWAYSRNMECRGMTLYGCE